MEKGRGRSAQGWVGLLGSIGASTVFLRSARGGEDCSEAERSQTGKGMYCGRSGMSCCYIGQA